MRTDHAQKLYELSDEYLADAMPVAKKIAVAVGVVHYNVLQVRVVHTARCAVDWVQNNGRNAHQACVLLPLCAP